MDKVLVSDWLRNSDLIGEKETLLLQDLVDTYPYSQSLRLLYLVGLMNTNTTLFIEALKTSALYISDRKVLFNLIERVETKSDDNQKKSLVTTVQDEDASTEEDRTLNVIDSFLSTLPEESIDYSSLEVSSDYMGYLFEDDSVNNSENIKPLDGQHLIDDFLSKAKHLSGKRNLPEDDTQEPILVESDPKESVVTETPTPSDEVDSEDDGFFTETLAKIYIKQKRYTKALEILKKLSLKYPNKNAYFVDQIRFLEKLIINAKSK